MNPPDNPRPVPGSSSGKPARRPVPVSADTGVPARRDVSVPVAEQAAAETPRRASRSQLDAREQSTYDELISVIDQDGNVYATGGLIEEAEYQRERRFLGLSAAERALISIIIFFNVLIIGAVLLILTGRMQF